MTDDELKQWLQRYLANHPDEQPYFEYGERHEYTPPPAPG